MIKNTDGVVAVLMMLVISVVVLVTTVSVVLLGISEARNSLDFRRGQEALRIAEGCADEALLRTRDDGNYTGGSLDVGDGSCVIVVTTGALGDEIRVDSLLPGPPDFAKSLLVTSQQDGNGVTVIQWQEVY